MWNTLCGTKRFPTEGMSPTTPDEAERALRDLDADIDLLSIAASWQDTLADEEILDLLKNWTAELPLFQTIIASRPRGPKPK
jgi:hypothetical protein